MEAGELVVNTNTCLRGVLQGRGGASQRYGVSLRRTMGRIISIMRVLAAARSDLRGNGQVGEISRDAPGKLGDFSAARNMCRVSLRPRR